MNMTVLRTETDVLESLNKAKLEARCVDNADDQHHIVQWALKIVESAYDEGYVTGRDSEHDAGYSEGYEEGFDAGHEEGCGAGYDKGYAEGKLAVG